MTSKLDQALDDVIKDRRRDGNSGRRNNNNNNNRRNDRGRDVSFKRDNNGGIRKRLGNQGSNVIRSFVRTVNVKNDKRGGRDVNSQWAHDMFDDEDGFSGSQRSVLSRLGNSKSINERVNRGGVEIKIENLHYDITEKDLQELFATIGEVLKARLVFDPSGRSTGVGFVKYNSMSDAEKAIEKYNKVEFDGQPMSIEIKEQSVRREGNRGSRGNRSDRFGGRNHGHRDGRDKRPRENKGRNDRNKQNLTAEDLDKEMDSYMNTNNEDTDMIED